MSAGIGPTRVWLGRYYKVDADPVRSQRKIRTCLVVYQHRDSGKIVTLAVDGGSFPVKKFNSDVLDWRHVEQHGGYHLHIIGRINFDGTVTPHSDSIPQIHDLALADNMKVVSAVERYLNNDKWMKEMQYFHAKSPLEEKHKLPGIGE
ncbi:MAG: hypothetical protein ACOVQN_04390 [Exiguobacterium sp.]